MRSFIGEYLVPLVYGIPTWALGIAIVLVFLVVGLGGLVLTKDWLHDRCGLHEGTNEAINGFFAGVGVLYGLLLSMVAIANWNNFDDVEEITSKESGSIAALYSDIGALHEPERTNLQICLKDYLHMIVNVEWPAHALGKASVDKVNSLASLQDGLTRYQPDSLNQQEMFTRSLDSFNRLIELRQQRIDAVGDERVPEVFWYVILLGGMLSIVMTYFFHLPSFLAHVLLTGLYATFLGLMVFLIAAVDNPFRGGISVKPTNYLYLIDALQDGAS